MLPIAPDMETSPETAGGRLFETEDEETRTDTETMKPVENEIKIVKIRKICVNEPLYKPVRNILQELSRRNVAFRRDSEFLLLTRDGLIPPTAEALADAVERICRLYRVTPTGKEIRCGCSIPLAKRILNAPHTWSDASANLPEVTGVIKQPVMREDGEIIYQRGLDMTTGLFLVKDYPPIVSHTSEIAALQAVAKELWEPISLFPYVTPADAGAAFALLLSAAERPVLPTCPIFVISAPDYGSGKTYLAQVAGLLAGGNGDVMATSTDEEEMRKTILAVLRAGQPHIIFDNMSGILRGDALAASITSAVFSGRLLGKSETVGAPNRALWLFTGVNLTAVDDLVRRVIVIRLDPKTDNPASRKFTFNPLALMRERQEQYHRLALILLQAAQRAGAGSLQTSSVGSFEEWNTFIRKAVLWMIDEGITPVEMADPIDTQCRERAEDTRLELQTTFLHVWYQLFEGRALTVLEAKAKAERAALGLGLGPISKKEAGAALCEVFNEIGLRGSAFSPRLVGSYFRRWAGSRHEGLQLLKAESRSRLGARWKVVKVQ
ncbi:MAG: hypothetical protein WCY67_09020 [Acidithiobacillus sp.]